MAIDANSLVTLADFKNYAGITVGTDDVLLQQTIDRASAVVCAYCGRKFVQQTFLEIRDTYGHERIALKQSPVSIVRFVGVGWDSAMTVQSTVATDAFSSISVDNEHIHLHRIQSSGSSQTTTINLASHDTSVEMAAHISGITGFSASALLNVPSTYLRKLVGRDLKNSVAYLEAPTDSLYDYQADPGETKNLAKSQAELVKTLAARLQAMPEAKPQLKAAAAADAPKRPAAGQDRAEMFARRDADKDGKLTKEEFLSQQPDPKDAPARFTRFDSDGNGVLSKEEFVNGSAAKK
jgi:hypothetical protein